MGAHGAWPGVAVSCWGPALALSRWSWVVVLITFGPASPAAPARPGPARLGSSVAGLHRVDAGCRCCRWLHRCSQGQGRALHGNNNKLVSQGLSPRRSGQFQGQPLQLLRAARQSGDADRRRSLVTLLESQPRILRVDLEIRGRSEELQGLALKLISLQ